MLVCRFVGVRVWSMRERAATASALRRGCGPHGGWRGGIFALLCERRSGVVLAAALLRVVLAAALLRVVLAAALLRVVLAAALLRVVLAVRSACSPGLLRDAAVARAHPHTYSPHWATLRRAVVLRPLCGEHSRGHFGCAGQVELDAASLDASLDAELRGLAQDPAPGPTQDGPEAGGEAGASPLRRVMDLVRSEIAAAKT
jgi:hypothetical protein